MARQRQAQEAPRSARASAVTKRTAPVTASAREQLAAIYRVVRAIPRGRVATYGQLALLAGIPSGHRIAARAMRSCPDGLPWYRVMAKKDARRAKIALAEPEHAREQQQRLRAEGVSFDRDGHVVLRQFGWLPVEAREPAAKAARAPSQKRAKAARGAAGEKKNR